ncbi:MAG: cobalt-precorrin-5B (C(1))-methyltransferase [Firmicutes bacterium]|nr:cobalt-precorrin-5B (C(1))-methyltransferase [Bacillota bacterium]
MKKLREGFTTGSCAAAAALACCLWQRDGTCPEAVELEVPGGKVYRPQIVPHEDGSCGIIKDSGDDPDITKGMEVISRVDVSQEDGPIVFRGGDGIGTITQKGLKIPVGEPAINPVPREMIEAAVRSVFGSKAPP